MKVLFVRDVKGTAKSGEMKEVSDGYARNFLIPRGLAVAASADNVNAASLKKKAEEHRVALARKDAEALATAIADMPVVMKAKCGENGKLFGSITAGDIADEFTAKYGIELDKKKLSMKEAIKETGEYEIPVKLFASISSTLKVKVEG